MRRVYETGEPDVRREVHTWVVVDGRKLEQYWDSANVPVRGAPASSMGGAPTPPAIALTAYARPDDIERALRAGFQEHLKKPVEPHRLLATVKAWTNQAAAEGTR